jgi:hypothetical protein
LRGFLSRVLPRVSGAGVAEKFATRTVGADEGKLDGNGGSGGGVAGAWGWQSAVEIGRTVAGADSVQLDPGGAEVHHFGSGI